jgi:hypothetical protein
MDLKIIFILIVVLLVIYWISQTQKEHFRWIQYESYNPKYTNCKKQSGIISSVNIPISNKSDPVIITNLNKFLDLNCVKSLGGKVVYDESKKMYKCDYIKNKVSTRSNVSYCSSYDESDFSNLLNEPNQLCGPKYLGNSNSYKSNLSAECAAGNGSWVNSSKGKKKCQNYYEKIYTNLGPNKTGDDINKASCRPIKMSRA